MDDLNLTECLKYIDPALIDYQEWCSIGMALKHEGCAVAVWDEWSRRDSKRYHPGECDSKWETFNGSATPVTVGTIVQLAKDNGWRRHTEDKELDWDSEIGKHDDLKIIDKSWLEGKELDIPQEWNPVQQITKYLETLFEASETVGYVTESYQHENGRFLPTKGSYTQTAGELIEGLNNCGGDIGRVIGDYKPEAGAWIRFNPLDGTGVKNGNVTDFRYALVESDTTDLNHQNQILRELELPIAALVYSGSKSIHAIVRIDASDYKEYQKRVDYLYEVCRKNGLEIDRQNKNPSRLSRMPGIERGEKKQYLLETNIGKATFNDWRDWIESINDDLPEPESMADVWDNLPELSPSLIDGVLRQGHKMLLAGPSKAGKSFALIELCISIAEGRRWLGFECSQGKVMYVNLELDRASCLHRFKDTYAALKWQPDNIKNIEIWNLRGRSIPMDKLAPKLIRRAAKKNYIAIVIDPIYKVITGDENSADQMANFCNQFDKVCTELGCAVIYCHHHSKGAQGGKQSMDRASGSGVFARDPDALLDLIELTNLSDALIAQEENIAVCDICKKWLDRFLPQKWESDVSQDDMCVDKKMLEICHKMLSDATYSHVAKEAEASRQALRKRTAWRIEGTLREYPKFEPLNIWFDYPIHIPDATGLLKGVEPENGFSSKGSSYKQNFKGKKTKEQRAKERSESLESAFEMCAEDGKAKVSELAECMGKSEDTIRRYLKERKKFWIEDGFTGLKS